MTSSDFPFASMDPERWSRIERVFLRALEVDDAEERAALLDGLCVSDAELRRGVEELLAAREDAEEVLGAAARRSGIPGPGSPVAPPGPGLELGAYRLVREIGRGGMGAVYLGERSDRMFEKQVAVKLLPSALGGAALRERFDRERRILARLDHPGIARLLDGGIASDGTPYFVMEYVQGRPIDAHCDHLRLGPEARIRLFLQVCDAVEYAHRNLIIHRDIKPANILVTEEGRVKLLDFGIARLQEEGDTGETTALTRWGGRPLTPAYASPEQVRGAPLTTATDVYSLGVLLHLLLSGREPYDVSGASPAEVERVVCHTDPVPPSRAVAHPDPASRPATGFAHSREPARGRRAIRDRADAAGVALARGTTPRGLRRRLQGDLDTIVLAALRKEPEHRYGSPAAMAADLRRHLEGRPVSARPAGLGYRARKLVTRRPGAVGAAAAALLAFGGYAATLHVHADRLETERNSARTEADRREQVTEFLLGLFAAADPAEARGEPLTAHDLIDRGADQLDRLAGDPEIHAEILTVMSRVYHSLGSYDRAASMARQALEERRRALGDEHLDVAESMVRLGRAVAMQGDDLDEAEQLRRAALDVRRRALGDDHPDVAASLAEVAALHLRKGDVDEAERHYREALALHRRHGDLASEAASLNGLGIVSTRLGNLDEAERAHRAALEIQRRVLGPDHPSVAAGLDNLGVVLRRLGDLAGAEQQHRASLELRRTVLGDEHPNVAATLNNLALVLGLQDDHDGAAQHFREALELRRRALGEEHPAVAHMRGNLGNALRRLAVEHVARGEREDAEAYLREALQHYDAAFADTHPSVLEARDELALLIGSDGGG